MDEMEPNPDLRLGRPILTDDAGGESKEGSSGFSFSFGEICYVLYRHRWLVAFFSLAGLLGAVAVFKLTPKLFRSEVQVMVKYVADNRDSLGPQAKDEPEKASVLRGEAVVDSELPLLSSGDLANEVAQEVGPERILAAMGGGTNLLRAAQVVQKGTFAYVAGGNVLGIEFKHLDPTVVQPVLDALVSHYFTNHYKVHRALANVDKYREQRDLTREELAHVESEFLAFKKTNGVFSIEDAKKNSSELIQKVDGLLNDARTELLESQGTLKLFPEAVLKAAPDRIDEARHEKLVEEYANLASEIDVRRKSESSFLQQGYLPSSKLIQPSKQQILELEKKMKKLEAQDPSLVGLGGASGTNQILDPFLQKQKIRFLEAKVGSLTNRLQQLRAAEASLYDMEGQYLQLQRKREEKEKLYSWYSTLVDKAEADLSLGAGRFSNISLIETPTAPVPVVVPRFKRLLQVAFGGVGLGVALAFLIEMFVDQKVKRPSELQRLLPVPIYVSVPRLGRKAKQKSLTARSSKLLGEGNSESGTGMDGSAEADVRLLPYFAALRDRVLNHFENLARKPKLVGVCACGDSGGGPETAAGLAAALSESGDLKVLLVDMKSDRSKTSIPVRGRKQCTLLEALETPKRQEAEVAPNLYLASANGIGDSQAFASPTRFTSVVPQLNASDYDFIVFDMPPMEPISVTPRLAKYMDLTLLVVEAEKAHRNVVKQAGGLLLEFTPHVGVVLNNTEARLPKWLAAAIAS